MKNFFTLTLCFLTLSLTAQEACPNPYDGNGDGNVSIGDFLEMLAVFGDTDTDSDGVWDSLDYCVDLAACNYANDPSEPCAYIDVLGVCGGGCEGDGDDDGICDSEDDCVGVLDECGVCNGPGPTEVIIDDITILYDSVYLPQLEEWYVYEFSADTTFIYTCAPAFATCGDLVYHDGYHYSTVLIGEQCWFSENCRYLPEVSPSSADSYYSPYYYVYDYEGTTVAEAKATENYETYGVLYNWPAVMTDEICPSGWHVPTDGEWTQLTDYLGGESVAGHAMKSTSGWNNNGNGSNSSGFTGLPSGYYAPWPGAFNYVGNGCYWWSSSENYDYGANNSWFYSLVFSHGILIGGANAQHDGFSARCVIDYTDECGVLNGDNSTCLDECGVPNGDNSTCLDECGVPNGDNSTCSDECGVPNGDNSTCFTNCGDDIEHESYNYSTVQIGDQCWFSENCRYLPEVSLSSAGSDTSPYYYVYGYEGTTVAEAQATANYETYGVLYNWPAVMTGGICPSGWHIPSDGEWQTMEISLGMSEADAADTGSRGTDQGSQMKSTTGWNNVGNGTNSSGFNGSPGGYRYAGGFVGNGGYGDWWSASESFGSYSWGRELNYNNDYVYRDDTTPRSHGFSARCVIDYTDECGVINGDNSTCTDNCGVVNGDNSTCTDNCGVVNGTNDCIACGEDIAHEGYDYSTVQIGDQCWFSENCRYLPEVSSYSASSTSDPYYYVYGYEGTTVAAAKATEYYEMYGVLYNWPAVITEGVCPSGWNVPSDGEWQIMEISLGMSEADAADTGWRGTDEGYQMKSTSGWSNGSNSSGFNGLPSGRSSSSGFEFSGSSGYWWSASESFGSYSWNRLLSNSLDSVLRNSFIQTFGFSARCVRD
jgi:uncharacterized protein (TIGR02145 family)